MKTGFLPPANEVCEGNVFTGVCLSRGGSVRKTPYGNVRGVRILLECILVNLDFTSTTGHNKTRHHRYEPFKPCLQLSLKLLFYSSHFISINSATELHSTPFYMVGKSGDFDGVNKALVPLRPCSHLTFSRFFNHLNMGRTHFYGTVHM